MGGSSKEHRTTEGAMISKNVLMFVTVGILSTLVLGAIAELKMEDKTMALAGTKTAVQGTIPLIDRNVPTATQTATFALG